MQTLTIPYENTNIDIHDYLTQTIEHHQKATPYWQQRLTRGSRTNIAGSNVEEMLSNLVRLEVDQTVLRSNWLGFKPVATENMTCSFSSGTTGPQKYCLWAEHYIQTMANYLHYYISKRHISVGNAIIQGPSSVFKPVNERMVNKFHGIPYFVGLRVEGIKPVLDDALKKGQAEIVRVIKDYFAPEIEKTDTFLRNDPSITFMRSAWMMLAPFEIFFGDKRNIDTVMVSGLGYTPDNHQMLKGKFKNVIHSYGYFAFGDALGVEKDGNLDYYPSFPYAIATVVKDNGEIADYGQQGHPVFIIARRDLFLVLKEDKEWAVRVPPTEGFNWDGIRNPYRSV